MEEVGTTFERTEKRKDLPSRVDPCGLRRVRPCVPVPFRRLFYTFPNPLYPHSNFPGFVSVSTGCSLLHNGSYMTEKRKDPTTLPSSVEPVHTGARVTSSDLHSGRRRVVDSVPPFVSLLQKKVLLSWRQRYCVGDDNSVTHWTCSQLES